MSAATRQLVVRQPERVELLDARGRRAGRRAVGRGGARPSAVASAPDAAMSSSAIRRRRAPQEIRQPRPDLVVVQHVEAGLARDRGSRSRRGRGSSDPAASRAAPDRRRRRSRWPRRRTPTDRRSRRPPRRRAAAASRAGRTRARSSSRHALSPAPDGVQPTSASRRAGSASARAAAPAASVSAEAISAPDTSCVEKSLSNGSLTSSGSDAKPGRVVSPSRSASVLSYSMRDSRCSPVGPTDRAAVRIDATSGAFVLADVAGARGARRRGEQDSD